MDPEEEEHHFLTAFSGIKSFNKTTLQLPYHPTYHLAYRFLVDPEYLRHLLLSPVIFCPAIRREGGSPSVPRREGDPIPLQESPG